MRIQSRLLLCCAALLLVFVSACSDDSDDVDRRVDDQGLNTDVGQDRDAGNATDAFVSPEDAELDSSLVDQGVDLDPDWTIDMTLGDARIDDAFVDAELADASVDAIVDAMPLAESVWAILETNGNHGRFLDWVETVGYRSALEGVGRFTVFAPRDDQVNEFVTRTNFDQADIAALTRLVEYHLVEEVLSAEDIRGRATIPTVNRLSLRVSLDNGELVLNEEVRLSEESAASNGVVHTIDQVFDPDVQPVANNVIDILRTQNRYSAYLRLVEQLGLIAELEALPAVTLFVPTNEAFANWELINGSLDSYADQQLRFLVERHIVDAVDVLNDGAQPLSYAGISLPITQDGAQFSVAGAEIDGDPQPAQNGAVYPLSSVIERERDATLYEWLVGDGRFTFFTMSLVAEGLDVVLDRENWTSLLTVLAPTDTAWQQFLSEPANNASELLSDPDQRGEFLRNHILYFELYAEDLAQQSVAQTTSGRLLPIAGDVDTVLTVDGRALLETDVTTHNGVIHVIDAPLLPTPITENGSCDEPRNLTLAEQVLGSTKDGDSVFRVGPLSAGTYCASTFGSGFDTLLTAQRTCGTSAATDVVGTDIVPTVVLSSAVQITATEGETIYLTIGGERQQFGDFLVEMTSGPCVNPLTLYELLELMPRYVTFLIGLDITDIGPQRLAVQGATTAFAPDEAAFDRLDDEAPGALDALLTDPEKLTQVISHHLVDGGHTVEALNMSSDWISLANQGISTSAGDGALFVNGAQIVDANLGANNGVLHTIEDVLMPQRPCISNDECPANEICRDAYCIVAPPPGNLWEELNETGEHLRFIQLLTAAELDDPLAFQVKTIFAPTDDAFELLDELMPDYVSDLVNDAEALRAFLDYHIVSGRYDTSDLFAVDRLLTERGLLLDIHATLSRIAVGTDSEFTLELEDVGTVIGADIRAANGYVHSIDRVLFEPSVAEARHCDNPEVVTDFGAYVGTTDGSESSLIGGCSSQYCLADDLSTPEHVFRFEAPRSGKVCFNTAGSSFDTVVYVRSDCEDNTDSSCNGTLGDGGGFCEVCNDDSALAGIPHSAVEVNVEEGKSYFVVVDGCKDSFSGAPDEKGFFRLAVSDGPCTPLTSIMSVLNETPRRFRTLIYWLRLTGLDDLLNREDEYTLVAPTETAFNEMEFLYPGVQRTLVDDIDQLRSFLLYHVIRGRHSVDELRTIGRLDSEDGRFVEFAKRGGDFLANGQILKNGALDDLADNGFVHTTDHVLMPPADCSEGGGPACATEPTCLSQPLGCRCLLDQCMPVPPKETLWNELASRRYPPTGSCLSDFECGNGGSCQAGQCSLPMFSRFLGFVEESGLRPLFENSGPLTVFAPTNRAFERFESFFGTLYALVEGNPDEKEALIRYHFVRSYLNAEDLATMPEVLTDRGQYISLGVEDNRVTVDGTPFIAQNQNVYNGIFHVIDELLLPPTEFDGCGSPDFVTFGTYTGTIDGAGSLYHTTCGAEARFKERVFKFELDRNEQTRVCITTHGSEFDTVLHIRQSECTSITAQTSCDDGERFTCCSDFTELDGNNYLETSQLSLNAMPDVPYFIFLDSFRQDAAGEFTLNIIEGDCNEVPVLSTVSDVIELYEDRFEDFEKALDVTGLLELLAENAGHHTVFAPSAGSFEAWISRYQGFPTRLSDEDKTALRQELEYLIIPEYLSVSDLIGGGVYTSLAGAPLFLSQQGPGFFANGMPLVDTNLWAQNGVIHVLNDVLEPTAVCDEQTPCGVNELCHSLGWCEPQPPVGSCGQPIEAIIGLNETSTADAEGALNYEQGSCGGSSAHEKVFRYEERSQNRTLCVRTVHGDPINTVVYVRQNDCFDPAQEAVCNDDGLFVSNPLLSSLNLPTVVGETYYIFVDGYTLLDSGDVVLELVDGACE